MSYLIDTAGQIVSTEELRGVLEELLSRHFGARREIVGMDRKQSEYSSSSPIEELDVSLDDGARLHLIFKNVSNDALLESARKAKPRFIYDPRREIEVYRNLLSQQGLNTAAFYGAVESDTTQRYWLFIEKVSGLELYQIGDFAIWQDVARWLARMHSLFAEKDTEIRQRQHLLKHNADFYRTWIRRVEEFYQPGPLTQASPPIQHGIGQLIGSYHKVVERLIALPQTLVHGEFYAANVLIEQRPEGLRVCPVDWEMAAVGPGLIDLAALVSGKWTEAEKHALALAYRSALVQSKNPQSGPEEFLTDLKYCRLALAVQWLGWSRDWSPPPEHTQDWLREAMQLANTLN